MMFLCIGNLVDYLQLLEKEGVDYVKSLSVTRDIKSQLGLRRVLHLHKHQKFHNLA